ncbi:MAG: tetratricopeptide repeat protein [Candidatus Tritonobacter lacicola]|nr:tetratricopeptide repeat protein [Candidatus Tritonobacter lacicola]
MKTRKHRNKGVTRHLSGGRRARRFDRFFKVLVLVSAVLAIGLFAAVITYRILQRRQKSRASGYFSAALARSKEGDYREAAAAYEKIVEQEPGNINALNNLGILHASRGDSKAALDCFRKAIRPEINVEKSHYNLGNLYLAGGDITRAIKHYRSAGMLGRDYVKPHIMLAAIYESRGDRNSAVREYEKLLGIEREQQKRLLRESRLGRVEHANLRRAFEAQDLLCDGFIHERMGEYEKALAKYEAALAAEPFFIPALIRRGIVYFNRSEYGKAEREIREALGVDPELKGFEVALADLYFMDGKVDRVRDMFGSLVEAYPRSIILKDYLGGLLLKEEDYSGAERVFKETLALDPEYARAYGGLGNAYLRLGLDEEAEKQLRKAMELSPRDPGNYYNLACVFSKRGDIDGSFNWLSESVKRGFNDRKHIKSDPALENLRASGMLSRMKL